MTSAGWLALLAISAIGAAHGASRRSHLLGTYPLDERSPLVNFLATVTLYPALLLAGAAAMASEGYLIGGAILAGGILVGNPLATLVFAAFDHGRSGQASTVASLLTGLILAVSAFVSFWQVP